MALQKLRGGVRMAHCVGTPKHHRQHTTPTTKLKVKLRLTGEVCREPNTHASSVEYVTGSWLRRLFSSSSQSDSNEEAERDISDTDVRCCKQAFLNIQHRSINLRYLNSGRVPRRVSTACSFQSLRTQFLTVQRLQLCPLSPYFGLASQDCGTGE